MNHPNCPNSASISEPSVDCSKISLQYANKCPCSGDGQSLLRPAIVIDPSYTEYNGDSDRRIACRDYLYCAEQGKIKNNCKYQS